MYETSRDFPQAKPDIEINVRFLLKKHGDLYLYYIISLYKLSWDCRRSQILPTFTGFKLKVKNKFETQKYACIRIIP